MKQYNRWNIDIICTAWWLTLPRKKSAEVTLKLSINMIGNTHFTNKLLQANRQVINFVNIWFYKWFCN